MNVIHVDVKNKQTGRINSRNGDGRKTSYEHNGIAVKISKDKTPKN